MSHLTCFHKLLKKLVCQGPCFPKACWPEGPVAKRPQDWPGLHVNSGIFWFLAPAYLLMFPFQLVLKLVTNLAPLLSPTKFPTALNLPQRGRRNKFWGLWTEVTYVPRSFLPSGQHYPFTPCPPSLIPHPPICLWPPCPGRLSRVIPSPSLVGLLLFEKADPPGRPALPRLVEFPVSFHKHLSGAFTSGEHLGRSPCWPLFGWALLISQVRASACHFHH